MTVKEQMIDNDIKLSTAIEETQKQVRLIKFAIFFMYVSLSGAILSVMFL